MDYLYICKKGTTMWNEMSNPAVLMRIGQRIKETRIRQHITQEELATASGVSPLTVANIEKGKSVSLLLFISGEGSGASMPLSPDGRCRRVKGCSCPVH